MVSTYLFLFQVYDLFQVGGYGKQVAPTIDLSKVQADLDTLNNEANSNKSLRRHNDYYYEYYYLNIGREGNTSLSSEYVLNCMSFYLRCFCKFATRRMKRIVSTTLANIMCGTQTYLFITIVEPFSQFGVLRLITVAFFSRLIYPITLKNELL